MSKIYKINAGIFVFTLIFFYLGVGLLKLDSIGGLLPVLGSIVIILIQTLTNLILGFVNLFKETGNAMHYFLSAIMVFLMALLIGIPTCFILFN